MRERVRDKKVTVTRFPSGLPQSFDGMSLSSILKNVFGTYPSVLEFEELEDVDTNRVRVYCNGVAPAGRTFGMMIELWFTRLITDSRKRFPKPDDDDENFASIDLQVGAVKYIGLIPVSSVRDAKGGHIFSYREKVKV